MDFYRHLKKERIERKNRKKRIQFLDFLVKFCVGSDVEIEIKVEVGVEVEVVI